MVIQDMTREMSTEVLKGSHLGRIACAQDAQPYIVPFFFAYHDRFIYSFATAGTRVEWMRANPLVCVEVEKIAGRHEWQTVVIFGQYQELPETPEFHQERVFAHDLLARTEIWWEPGYVKTLHRGIERPLQHIYFRILIDQISGHQGIGG
jgi:nitroimidazol reductase NimA-like FMN-containing flavoprotein (pyridoxamine 5'-phosphate oxidase superfamily)